jgi:hypothetical protein
MISITHAAVPLSLIAKPMDAADPDGLQLAGDAEPPCRWRDWPGVGLAILLTVPPHPGQDVSRSISLAGLIVDFRPAPRTDPGDYQMEPAAPMSASPVPAPGHEPTALRARGLASARRRATALLAGVTVLFVAVTAVGAHGVLLGYVQAGAEASMVNAT